MAFNQSGVAEIYCSGLYESLKSVDNFTLTLVVYSCYLSAESTAPQMLRYQKDMFNFRAQK